MDWDVFTKEMIKQKGGMLVTRWSLKESVTADSAEQLMERIRDLKVQGTFRAYPHEEGIVMQASVVNFYEMERLR